MNLNSKKSSKEIMNFDVIDSQTLPLSFTFKNIIETEKKNLTDPSVIMFIKEYRINSKQLLSKILSMDCDIVSEIHYFYEACQIESYDGIMSNKDEEQRLKWLEDEAPSYYNHILFNTSYSLAPVYETLNASFEAKKSLKNIFINIIVGWKKTLTNLIIENNQTLEIIKFLFEKEFLNINSHNWICKLHYKTIEELKKSTDIADIYGGENSEDYLSFFQSLNQFQQKASDYTIENCKNFKDHHSIKSTNYLQEILSRSTSIKNKSYFQEKVILALDNQKSKTSHICI